MNQQHPTKSHDFDRLQATKRTIYFLYILLDIISVHFKPVNDKILAYFLYKKSSTRSLWEALMAVANWRAKRREETKTLQGGRLLRPWKCADNENTYFTSEIYSFKPISVNMSLFCDDVTASVFPVLYKRHHGSFIDHGNWPSKPLADCHLLVDTTAEE